MLLYSFVSVVTSIIKFSERHLTAPVNLQLGPRMKRRSLIERGILLKRIKICQPGIVPSNSRRIDFQHLGSILAGNRLELLFVHKTTLLQVLHELQSPFVLLDRIVDTVHNVLQWRVP